VFEVSEAKQRRDLALKDCDVLAQSARNARAQFWILQPRTQRTQLGDALGEKPGIASTSFAPGTSRPIIRGLSGFRVGITENGISTGDVYAARFA
jgi:TonB-dependent receptor-like protein